ncbi:hypothetical protein EON67_11220 [archaeon]|nr:MAG: hypothetical protein EON67_11220 [archaeon]
MQASARESSRWAHMEAEREAEEARLARLRGGGGHARKNMSGQHYDPLTLSYNTTPEGHALRYV